MKEITFTFTDGSYYVIRPSNGDSICGPMAHTIMHAMNKHFNYSDPSYEFKVLYILGEIQKQTIKL